MVVLLLLYDLQVLLLQQHVMQQRQRVLLLLLLLLLLQLRDARGVGSLSVRGCANKALPGAVGASTVTIAASGAAAGAYPLSRTRGPRGRHGLWRLRLASRPGRALIRIVPPRIRIGHTPLGRPTAAPRTAAAAAAASPALQHRPCRRGRR